MNNYPVNPTPVNPTPAKPSPAKPSPADQSLANQREILRMKMAVQRKTIAHLIGARLQVPADTYPRSITMRFITRKPLLVAGILTELATLVLGVRVIKPMTTAIAVARVVSRATSATSAATSR